MHDVNVALLLFRVVFGVTMAAHGWAKVFQGGRLDGTAAWFDSIGMRPGALHARLAAGTEIAVGLGLAVGLLTSLSATGFVALMVVAGWTVHRNNGFFIVKEGWEYNMILAVGAVVIAMLGPGRWSLDAALGIDTALDGWIGLLIAGIGGVVAGVGQLAIFFRPPMA